MSWGVLVMLVGVMTAALLWAGGQEWEAPWAIPWVAGQVSRWTKWSVTIGHLWVTPWRGLRAQDIMIQPQGAGRLQAQSVVMDYRARDLFAGRFSSRWWIRQVRMDPGSWKIHRAAAVAQLSSGPVVDWMSVRASVTANDLTVERIRAVGPALRFHGAARWRADGTMQCWVRGHFSTTALAALGLRRLHGHWEPFWFGMSGPVRQPALRLKTRSLSLNTGVS